MKFETKAIRYGYKQTKEKEHSEAIFPTSSFTFDSAEQAEKAFNKTNKANIYSRFTNPNVDSFIKRLAALENAKSGVATSSGMAAIFTTIMSNLSAGDHLVVSKNIFGSSVVLINNIISKYKISATWVNLNDINAWEAAIKANTKMFLLESPSNPLGEIVDIKKLSKISAKYNILLAVDNALMTPALQQPLSLGADIVIHSATKYIDGQGRTLAGAILANNKISKKMDTFLRSAGFSLSPFNAWICLKGLETLQLRMQKHSENALKLAIFLESKIKKVYYLGLKSHQHHYLAKLQQKDFGGIVSFDIGSKNAAYQLINNTKFISITANLGDAKTTITHPATTTHVRLSAKEKIAAGITDGLLRISVGLENIDDIIDDLKI